MEQHIYYNWVWICFTGGFQDRFWTVFPMFKKNQVFEISTLFGPKPLFDCSKYQKKFRSIGNITVKPLKFKKPGFCDAHKRRVRENVAHFMSKNRLRRKNCKKTRELKGKIRHLDWIKAYFTIFWSSSCSKKTRFLTKPGLETPPI